MAKPNAALRPSGLAYGAEVSMPVMLKAKVDAGVFSGPSPQWNQKFRASLATLLHWRRDVRHFKTDTVPNELISQLIELACLSPSVGNAQPWRFVRVDDAARREKIIESFEACDHDALNAQAPERQSAYSALKLAGLREAPVQIAVFCDSETATGHGLGRRTMPEMMPYSVVCAIHTLWLCARARGLGVGWVSILKPTAINTALDIPESWVLVAYLCIGWPKEDHETPELARRGWQDRHDASSFLYQR